jgi:hypothetical protein
MQAAPAQISGMPTVLYTVIDSRHEPTAACHHTIGGRELGAVAGLAICREPDGGGHYLFYCDTQWQALTDTWHATVEDAIQQAEFEYKGAATTWTRTA